ncbi:hypothetical protein CCGE531_11055 [Rhizobium sp. CCGE531]|nr:hypothetical protein CCGE531_11055 [Rhizobium sp. CCGE531]AYG72852.1 hypothetical protein CCGE532_10480 [Rhizobium sp. CCGE532]
MPQLHATKQRRFPRLSSHKIMKLLVNLLLKFPGLFKHGEMRSSEYMESVSKRARRSTKNMTIFIMK